MGRSRIDEQAATPNMQLLFETRELWRVVFVVAFKSCGVIEAATTKANEAVEAYVSKFI